MVKVNVSPEAAGRAFSLAGLLEQDIYDDAILPWHAEYGPALHLLSGLGSAEVSYPEWGSEAASSVASGEFGLGIEDPGANLDLYLENAAAGAIQTGHEALGYTEPVNMAADHYIQDNGGFHNGDMFADSIEESLTLARINLGLLE